MIRWINQHLGTASFTDPALGGTDHTVLDVRDLVDKQGNSPQTMRQRIEEGVSLLSQGRKLLICCDYGISRSNAIAAGVLAQFSGIPLEQAVREVMQATGEHEIKLEPLSAVRSALSKDAASTASDTLRVLLTGGSGFIGGRLQEALGEQVFCLAPSRSEADLLAGALELDLLVKEHRINRIVHLANPRVYTSNRAMGESVTLLRNVLEVCRENEIPLIYPSSWEVYSGYRVAMLLADEGVPLFPKGPYGETKLLCEQLIELHRNRYGLKCAMLRSSPLYGETSDRPKFIYNFLAKALRGEPIYTHLYLNGEPHLDLLHVDDFVTAAVSALRSGFVGTMNIGSGQAVSTRKVAEWIAHYCGSTSAVESKPVADYAANITMDFKRAESGLGWRPTIPWQDGLAGIIQGSMKNAGHERG